MQKQITYTFHPVAECNMCGSTDFKVLGKRLSQSQGMRPQKLTGITTTVCQCNQCGLNFSNPQPVPASIQDHYGMPPEDYWKPEYFVITDDLFSNEKKRLLEQIDFKPGMKALDIGAGVGRVMITLDAMGFDTFGLEPSQPFYERAISKMGVDPERIQMKMVEEADFEDDAFDFITLGVVLEHLYDPAAALKKSMKWLKPGGVMHIEVPSSRWFVAKIINFIYRVRGLDYVGNLSPMHEPFHLFEFDLESFKRNAAQGGYEIAFYEYFVANTYMPKLLQRPIRRYMRRTNTGMQLSIWLRKTAS